MTKVLAYSAAKAAVNNLTMWLAVHFAEAGIRVNAIAPGFFLTEQNRTLLTNKDGSLTQRSEKIISHTPMRRFGKPEDLLGTMLWLADASTSGFVTGITVPVDGGFQLRRSVSTALGSKKSRFFTPCCRVFARKRLLRTITI